MMDSARTGARIGCGGGLFSAEAASRPGKEGTMTGSTSGDLPPPQTSRPSLARNGSARPVCVVTGASAGVGRATALTFARRGWRVAILARGAHGLDSAHREIEAAGGKALPFRADVADPEAIFAAADEVVGT